MNIKQKIGKRIGETRREAGLTIKQLAERTIDLKPARIGNWEQGTRCPGPLEAKVLAEALGVTASYLLYLSDDPKKNDGMQARVMPRCVAILSYEQATYPNCKADPLFKNKLESTHEFDRVPIGKNLTSRLSEDAFALIIEDDSMLPEFAPGDVVIADRAMPIKPGHYVIAQISKQKKAVIRKFRELDEGFELLPLNADWATLSVRSPKDGSVIATVIEHRRLLS